MNELARSPDERAALEWAIGHFADKRADLTAKGKRNASITSYVELLISLYDDGGDAGAVELLTEVYDDSRYNDGREYHFLFGLTSNDLTDLRREFLAALLERGGPLPEAARHFNVDFLRNPRATKQPRSRDPHELRHRNILIGLAIEEIVKRWRFAATRNEATVGVKASAASIVRDALKKSANIDLSEAAINKIYIRFVSNRNTLIPD